MVNKEIAMEKIRKFTVNSVGIEMLDVRPDALLAGGWRFGDLEQLERLCNNLSTEADYKKLWDHVVVKPKWDEIFPENQPISEAQATLFRKMMLPVLLPVIGYSRVPTFKAVEEIQRWINERLAWLIVHSTQLHARSKYFSIPTLGALYWNSISRFGKRTFKSEWMRMENN